MNTLALKLPQIEHFLIFQRNCGTQDAGTAKHALKSLKRDLSISLQTSDYTVIQFSWFSNSVVLKISRNLCFLKTPLDILQHMVRDHTLGNPETVGRNLSSSFLMNDSASAGADSLCSCPHSAAVCLSRVCCELGA